VDDTDDVTEPLEPADETASETNLLGDAVEVLFGLLSPAIAAGQGIAPTVSRIANWGPVRGVSGAAGRTLEGWRARGKTEQQRFLEVLDDFIRRTLPGVIDAVFDHVDVNDIIGRIDLNRVMGEVDLNALMSKVDLDAMLERVDFGKLTDRLIEEVDLRQIMRESSSSITSEAVDAVRVQGMNADRFVDRLVDRILFRKNGRDLAGPVPVVAEFAGGPTTNGQDPHPEEGSADGDAGRIGVAASEDQG
jgi:hypothetical protein